MSLFEHILLIILLISVSAFFSMSEIALAASRKLRLRQLVSEGDSRASQVLSLQEHPGSFFTIIQIGLNAVAILGGILGEAAFTPTFVEFLQLFYQGPALQSIGFGLSVFLVTALVYSVCRFDAKTAGDAGTPNKWRSRWLGLFYCCWWY